MGPLYYQQITSEYQLLERFIFCNFLNFVKDGLSFFYFKKLSVLLLPDNLFKNNFSTQTSRVLWSGNSFCLLYFTISKVLMLTLDQTPLPTYPCVLYECPDTYVSKRQLGSAYYPAHISPDLPFRVLKFSQQNKCFCITK